VATLNEAPKSLSTGSYIFLNNSLTHNQFWEFKLKIKAHEISDILLTDIELSNLYNEEMRYGGAVRRQPFQSESVGSLSYK
jgi:hypothetical protein